MNKGSRVEAHGPLADGLAVDQVGLSESSRVSSRVPLRRVQITDHRQDWGGENRTKPKQKTGLSGTMGHMVLVLVLSPSTHTHQNICFRCS